MVPGVEDGRTVATSQIYVENFFYPNLRFHCIIKDPNEKNKLHLVPDRELENIWIFLDTF